jgi:hypothetical protein
MAISKRAAGIGLAVAALALTVTGVVIAATDPNPGGVAKDPLALNGYPPRSAQLLVTVSSGQQYHVTADVNVNFRTNAVEATMHIPMFFSTADVTLRLVDHHLYATSSTLSSIIGSSWLSTPMATPSLFGLSLEMTKPDIALISGFPQRVVTHDGYLTTYDYRRDNVGINAPSGLPISVPTRASIDFSITVGQEGELTAARFAVSSSHTHAWISVQVVSYNAPAHITAPPARDVKPVDTSFLSKILGSSSIGSLLSPQNVTSLSQIHLT